jgi:hypothetical protein
MPFIRRIEKTKILPRMNTDKRGSGKRSRIGIDSLAHPFAGVGFFAFNFSKRAYSISILVLISSHFGPHN